VASEVAFLAPPAMYGEERRELPGTQLLLPLGGGGGGASPCATVGVAAVRLTLLDSAPTDADRENPGKLSAALSSKSNSTGGSRRGSGRSRG
jgi:hypothetical protein